MNRTGPGEIALGAFKLALNTATHWYGVIVRTFSDP